MWASPRIIPTKISFISSGIVTRALSVEDRRTIPFVEREAQRTVLTDKSLVVSRSCWQYKYVNIYIHNITIMIGLYIHLKKILNVSRIASEDPTNTEGL